MKLLCSATCKTGNTGLSQLNEQCVNMRETDSAVE